MSQYPPGYYPPSLPYSPGYPYGTAYNDPRGAARRAGMFMIILGALTLVIGLCAGIIGIALPKILPQMPPEQAAKLHEMESQVHMPLQELYIGIALVLLVGGILYIVLGLLSRRGGLGSVVTSIVLTSVTILLLAINGLFGMAQQGGLVGGCFCFVALSLFILQLVWLIQAARASGRIRLMEDQYRAQYMQYQQMQQQQWMQQQPPPQNPPTPQS